MRTTLTLDEDVVRLLEDEKHRTRRTFKEVVNDAVRRGLTERRRRRTPKYSAPVLHAELAPGVDPAGFNRLSDEIETEALTRRRPR